MEISYNLRYQKQNFSNKMILDKEGEIIIYAKGFRLKGKGATDKGELINFSEIKEFFHRNGKIIFVTFNKEKYILFEAGTLFEQLLIDIYKSRNEFLMDALFMKKGKLKAEFEGQFQRFSKFGKPINKGEAKFRMYEGSMIILPPDQDAFSIHYDFVNFYEFDDIEYTFKGVNDDGVNIILSHLGNDYEFFGEKMDELLGGMYERIINEVLKQIFIEFHSGTLLKLAYKMKGGKAVSLKEIQKMDKDLSVAVDNYIFEEDEEFKEKTKILKELVDEYGLFFGIARDQNIPDTFVKWVMFSIPEKNIVGFSILPRWKEEEKQAHDTYFYKIIMESGRPAEKMDDKIKEIEQALVNLNFAKDPCYKDKRELKHSPYQYAIRKLPYLRILRKSYVGKASSEDAKEWQKQAKEIMTKAELKN